MEVEKEKWKDIPNFSNYQVSNLGRVKSKRHTYTRKDGVSGTRKEKILSNKRNDKSKYINVVLKDDKGKPTNCNVHRIVAETWIDRDDPTLIVNHKDGNKHNNSIDNLEWVTTGENNSHAYRNSLKESVGKKSCVIIDIKGNRREYSSLKELSIEENINYGTLSSSISRGTILRSGSKVFYI